LMAMTLEEANALLLEERSKTMQAAAAGKMLVQNVDQLSKEAVELRAEIASLRDIVASLKSKSSDVEAKNEHLQQANETYAKLMKEMEAEHEELHDEKGSQQGATGNAVLKAKQLEIKCRESEDTVELLRTELDKAKNDIESLTKANRNLKTERDETAAKLKTAEARTQEMEEIVKKRESELRSSSKTAGDDAQGEVRAMKEKSDVLYREHELVRKKLNELQDVNNILTKQHEDDQTLIEDVKATNMMLREALETKELEWGTSDGQLANFAPKESLLGEIEQHFNRFQTFGSPVRGSSKVPNFMDVVKRDFENLAMRIHRLRQKMEKKWPEPPAGGLPVGGVVAAPAATAN